MSDKENRFLSEDDSRFMPESDEPDSIYYGRIDITEDHPVIAPALRRMMNKKVSKFPPFLERAEKFGLGKDATLVDVFVMSMLASALGGDSEAQKIIIDRLDGRILNVAPPVPKRSANNGTKNSLENLTNEQLQKMMKEDADTDSK